MRRRRSTGRTSSSSARSASDASPSRARRAELRPDQGSAGQNRQGKEEILMAKIALGLGVSHSPQLSFPAEKWADLGRADQTSPHLIHGAGRPISPQDPLKR